MCSSLFQAVGIVSCGLMVAVSADEPQNRPATTESTIAVRLVDEGNAPVAGAEVGVFVLVRPHAEKPRGEWSFVGGTMTDESGVAQLKREPTRPFVIARHEQRKIIGIAEAADISEQGELAITLSPECNVSLQLFSPELTQRGLSVQKSMALVGSKGRWFGFFYGNDNSLIHAWLPPGKHEFDLHGKNIHYQPKEIEIQNGDTEFALETIECPATQLALLEGRTAPEIEDVAAWKNGPPVKLADLRGRYVLIEFWGWWCGPCVYRSIPELIKMNEATQYRGLVVVGIHTPHDTEDDIDTTEELDHKLADVRAKAWDGQDIPFPVAMTRPHTGSYFPGGPAATASRMAFEYGVIAWPTSILIDPQGNVVGAIDVTDETDRARLAKLLDVE